jgi:SAM-dependent MidA family methyltransferase
MIARLPEAIGYDPDARRDTALARKLADRIRRSGPISVHDFMAACLGDPEHGYYPTRPAIGREGDFVTAPEITQVFGEFIGLWAAVVWQQMGSHARVDLVEIGPGRGTLIADALRAIAKVPAFAAAVRVRLVEVSEPLAALQRERLAGDPRISWAAEWPALDAATIVIANEVLDTEPIAQHVLTPDGWQARTVALDGAGRLAFFTAPIAASVADPIARRWPDARPGAIVETADTNLSNWLAVELARAPERPIAGLLIDYGHTTSALGDTLQAVRGHAYEHPLTSPGEADLTAQVDFAEVRLHLSRAGFAVDRSTPQAEFLGRLGIVERASRMMAANPAKAATIEAAIARVMAPGGMGTRFLCLGLRSPHLPPLPGF